MNIEEKARQKAREDYRYEAVCMNNYPDGSIESLAYQAEFIRVAGIFGEQGECYA